MIKGFPGDLAVKNLLQMQRAAGDAGLISGLGRSLEEGMATLFSIPAWRIPWREKPGRL